MQFGWGEPEGQVFKKYLIFKGRGFEVWMKTIFRYSLATYHLPTNKSFDDIGFSRNSVSLFGTDL